MFKKIQKIFKPHAASGCNIDVKAGDYQSVDNTTTVLKTRGLSDCFCVCILDNMNANGIYTKRLMAHLMGGNLEFAFNIKSSDAFIEHMEMTHKNRKVIFISGVDANSDFSIQSTINQDYKGGYPLYDLLFNKMVIADFYVGSNVTLFANGEVTSEAGFIRGINDEIGRRKFMAMIKDYH